MGLTIRPLFVKKLETFSPRSADVAIFSAETGRLVLRVFFIKDSFLTGRLPQGDQVIILAVIVLSDFEYDRIEFAFDPANSSVLLRYVGAMIQIEWLSEQLLCFLKSDTPARILSQGVALRFAESEPHIIMV